MGMTNKDQDATRQSCDFTFIPKVLPLNGNRLASDPLRAVIIVERKAKISEGLSRPDVGSGTS